MRGSWVVGLAVAGAVTMVAVTTAGGRQSPSPRETSCEALRSFRQPDVAIVDAGKGSEDEAENFECR